jgi:predicted DNA-binding transcriptional regulator
VCYGRDNLFYWKISPPEKNSSEYSQYPGPLPPGGEKINKIKWTDYNNKTKPLTDIQITILNYIAEKDAAFIQELANELGVSNPTIYNAVNKLYHRKLIKRIKIEPGSLFVPSELVNRIAEFHKTKTYPANKLKYFHWIALADGIKKDTIKEVVIDE